MEVRSVLLYCYVHQQIVRYIEVSSREVQLYSIRDMCFI